MARARHKFITYNVRLPPNFLPIRHCFATQLLPLYTHGLRFLQRLRRPLLRPTRFIWRRRKAPADGGGEGRGHQPGYP